MDEHIKSLFVQYIDTIKRFDNVIFTNKLYVKLNEFIIYYYTLHYQSK